MHKRIGVKFVNNDNGVTRFRPVFLGLIFGKMMGFIEFCCTGFKNDYI